MVFQTLILASTLEKMPWNSVVKKGLRTYDTHNKAVWHKSICQMSLDKWISQVLSKVISTSFDQEDHLKDLVTTKQHKVWISRHIFNDISCNHYTFQPTTLSNIEVSIAIIPLKFKERNRYVVQLSQYIVWE